MKSECLNRFVDFIITAEPDEPPSLAGFRSILADPRWLKSADLSVTIKFDFRGTLDLSISSFKRR